MKVELCMDPDRLDLASQTPDLRRNLHVYFAFVKDRKIKRGYRDNAMPKKDALQLAGLMAAPEAEDDIREDGYSNWLSFVEGIAEQMGWVHFDTEGTYASYRSQEPIFVDNYIEVDAQRYAKYTNMPLAKQETQLLEVLLQRHTGPASEFFSPFFRSRLHHFPRRGSATGVVPTLDFPNARSLLLGLLADLPSGEWLSTASFIEHLKTKHPYFLIPKKFDVVKSDRKSGRYDNFYEDLQYHREESIVNASDPDAFDRVEGRYVERFLEGIPFLLGYVDLGYEKTRRANQLELNGIPAFRVHDRLRRALTKAMPEPTVRVTPTFEIYVQSDVYPAKVVAELESLAELVSDDTTIVYRLTKQKVATAQAADHSLDIVGRLEGMSTTPLPENVRHEIATWAKHSEKFVLYSGFGLLETQPSFSVPQKFQVAEISSGVHIVRSAKALVRMLEDQERMPVELSHGENEFAALPDGVLSALRGKKRKKVEREAKPQVTLMRVSRIQLLCPDREFLLRLQSLLAVSGCPVEADTRALALAFSDRYEPDVQKAIQSLKGEYRVKVENQN